MNVRSLFEHIVVIKGTGLGVWNQRHIVLLGYTMYATCPLDIKSDPWITLLYFENTLTCIPCYFLGVKMTLSLQFHFNFTNNHLLNFLDIHQIAYATILLPHLWKIYNQPSY